MSPGVGFLYLLLRTCIYFHAILNCTPEDYTCCRNNQIEFEIGGISPIYKHSPLNLEARNLATVTDA